MNLQTPNFKPKPVESPPTEAKLRMLLDNGPDLIDVVRTTVEKFKLPYDVVISDGSMFYVDRPSIMVPLGYGILRDTLSPGELHLKKFITEDPKTLEMKSDALNMAKSEHEVLIVGETGTGKEIIAKAMIGNRKGPIKAVNCAGFPEQLIESELFGHIQGAFTGAIKDKTGLFEAANEGVLFLDEIGELPMSVQAKLLRALQEKRVRKVGATTDQLINCKVVCATHRDLRKMVREDKFRKDLYARISTLELHIKPLLPDRKCDILPITESLKGGKEFLDKYQTDLLGGVLDLSLNVRSIQQHVIRYSVLGRIALNQ